MNEFVKQVGAQCLALFTFFAFPVIQYFLLRKFTRKEGAPELWFLPAYGFRLVIRNLPGKRTLSDIKYRVFIRTVVSAGSGISVATLMEEVLLEKEEQFLFPGVDQILISFRIERNASRSIDFIVADKRGVESRRVSIDAFEKLICDYGADLENLLNFDVKIGKRAELSSKSLLDIFEQIERDPIERSFPLDRIRDVH